MSFLIDKLNKFCYIVYILDYVQADLGKQSILEYTGMMQLSSDMFLYWSNMEVHKLYILCNTVLLYVVQSVLFSLSWPYTITFFPFRKNLLKSGTSASSTVR